MKSIVEYINESTKSQKNFWAEQFINSLTGTGVTKDNVIKMFDNLDMDVIKSLSNYLYETDVKNYISYQPNNDEFIGDKNREKIISQISDYIIKYITIKQ